MKYERSHRLPAGWKTMEAIDELKHQSKFIFTKSKGTGPVKRPIYTPTEKTKAKQKQKITLPKIRMPE